MFFCINFVKNLYKLCIIKINLKKLNKLQKICVEDSSIFWEKCLFIDKMMFVVVGNVRVLILEVYGKQKW